MSCGAELAAVCANCGTENPPGAKFCIECGSSLAAGATATPTPAAAPEAPPEERRQATVLFADLSGYTRLTEGYVGVCGVLIRKSAFSLSFLAIVALTAGAFGK